MKVSVAGGLRHHSDKTELTRRQLANAGGSWRFGTLVQDQILVAHLVSFGRLLPLDRPPPDGIGGDTEFLCGLLCGKPNGDGDTVRGKIPSPQGSGVRRDLLGVRFGWRCQFLHATGV